MPKVIIDNFIRGLAETDRDNSGKYFEGRGLDPDRNLGYLMPGLAVGAVSNAEIDQLFNDMLVNGNDCYFLGGTKLFQMTDVAAFTWAADFDGSSHSYQSITNATDSSKLIKYNISGTANLFFSYNTASAAYVGAYPFTGTTSDLDKLTLDSSSKSSPHPMIEWNSKLFIGEGQYMAKYDGANDAFTSKKLDLGEGWEVTSLFTTNNYIGICAWKKNSAGTSFRTSSKIFFWDGTLDTVAYSIPIYDNKIVNSINYNGEILLFTIESRFDSACSLKRLTDNGTEKISKLVFPINGVDIKFSSPSLGGIDIFNNKVIFASYGNDGINNYGSIFTYGKDNGLNQVSITNIGEAITAAIAVTANIGALKVVTNTNMLVSISTGVAPTTYYLKYLTLGFSIGSYKDCWHDFGQRVNVNYVKFYFKKLVSSDSINVGLDIDYTNGNTNSLGTITYTKDGAITSKKFVKSFICHSFRPVILWNAGVVAISKIVINYTFISD